MRHDSNLPPNSPEAEESLLSCCFLDGPEIVSRCLNARISRASFYDPKHAIVFERLLDLYNQQAPIDLAVVAEELKTAGQLDAIGGYAFLTQVSSRMPTTAQASYFIEKVRDLHRLRQVIAQAQRAQEQALQPNANASEIVSEFRERIDRIDDDGPGLGAGITAAALCENPPTIPAEIVAGVLYGGGTMMLSGPSKSRKTYTFLDAAVSIATGSPWLGFPTTKSAVLFLNFELSEHSFQRRLAAICHAKRVKPPANLRSFNLRGRIATMGKLAVELPRLIKAHGAGVVILDPWYKIAAQSGADENSNDGQARILAEAERIVTAGGAALIVGHHFAKGEAAAKNSIDRAAGAGAMARWGDVIATLSEHEEADAMTLDLHLRDFAPVPPIALRWKLPIWSRDKSLDPAKLKRAGRSDAHPSADLLAKLKDGMTAVEWRTAVDWSDSTFRRKRDELVDARKVVCQGATYRHA